MLGGLFLNVNIINIVYCFIYKEDRDGSKYSNAKLQIL